MTDIDYCNGYNCPKKQLCSRFHKYLTKKERNESVIYAMNGWHNEDCPQFKMKEYYGG